MSLGKRADGSTVGPSAAQQSVNAKRAALYPLRKVVASGIGYDPDHPNRDVDVLECGHILRGATDLVGRRWPDRRRCHDCGPRPHSCDDHARLMYEPRRAPGQPMREIRICQMCDKLLET